MNKKSIFCVHLFSMYIVSRMFLLSCEKHFFVHLNKQKGGKTYIVCDESYLDVCARM